MIFSSILKIPTGKRAKLDAVHDIISGGVPLEYTKITTNSASQDIVKGQLNKKRLFPKILNEHVENSSSIQSTITSSNIVGQIFKTSKDNITALLLTLESAAGSVLDDFESYNVSTDLQEVWSKGDSNEASLNTAIVKTGNKAMTIPGDIVNASWIKTISSTDYTDHTFNFDFHQNHTYSQLKYEFILSDGSNTLSFPITIVNENFWEHYSIDINAMIDSGVTDVSAIIKIGFRVVSKKIGKLGYVDNLTATPPAGEIEIKLWDMGTTIPIDGVTSINTGTQYEKIGIGEYASYVLQLKGGTRLYYIEQFNCGVDKSVSTNELLNIDHYYLLELKYIDTDVEIYGPDPSANINHYINGFAFTSSNEASAITKIGPYSNIMFGIMSRQAVYLLGSKWRFNTIPNGNSSFSMFLEDTEMKISDILLDYETSSDQKSDIDLSKRPMFLEDGGKFECYYNDDFTDDVSRITIEMLFLYIPSKING